MVNLDDEVAMETTRIRVQMVDFLRAANASQEVLRIILTCVDKDYAVKSLGVACAGIDVSYDSNHVQQVGEPTKFSQLFLAYDASSGGLVKIAKNEVHESLPKGIMQLALGKQDLVIGIPGDCYALDPEGKGFAFGVPDLAKGHVAQAALKSIVEHSTMKVPNSSVSTYLMMHPDCGLFANNVGKHDETCIKAAHDLVTHKRSFPNSEYCKIEGIAKNIAMGEAVSLLQQLLPGANISAIRPAYVTREAGIVNALKGGH